MPAPHYTLISRPSNPVYCITAVSIPVEDLSNRLDGRWMVKPYPSYDRHLDGCTHQTVRCAALLENIWLTVIRKHLAPYCLIPPPYSFPLSHHIIVISILIGSDKIYQCLYHLKFNRETLSHWPTLDHSYQRNLVSGAKITLGYTWLHCL